MPDAEVTNATPETPATPPAVETPPPETPVEQQRPAHSRRLLDLAVQYQIPPELVQAYSPDELRQEISDRQLEARDRAIREAVRGTPTPTPPPEEPSFELPPELAAEVGELNPALLKALKLAHADAVKKTSERFQKELQAVRAQTSGQTFAVQVAAEMNKFPEILGNNPARGTVEAERREALLSHLAAVEQQTGQALGLDAIEKAVKRIYGVVAKPAPPSPPPAPAPTPTARPTNRINGEDGNLTKDQLVDLWSNAFKEEDEANRNGAASRP